MRKTLSVSLAFPFVLALGATTAVAAHIDYANESNPGQKVDIGQYVSRGKVTIIEVGSPYCPDCLSSAPVLDRLEQKNHNFKIVHLDTNPKGLKGVPDSPLRKWVGASWVPHYIVFDADGKKLAESNGRGKNPRPLIINYFKENKITWKGF